MNHCAAFRDELPIDLTRFVHRNLNEIMRIG